MRVNVLNLFSVTFYMVVFQLQAWNVFKLTSDKAHVRIVRPKMPLTARGEEGPNTDIPTFAGQLLQKAFSS